ncbi:hypothetical protein OKW51_002456 [Pseudomonas hunanensis]|nr:hypothetical protein [Pseudomonas hunanensis]
MARQHQQLPIGELGGAVVLARQAGDEVEVRFAVLIDPRHLHGHRAHRLPTVAGADLGDDALQRCVLPAAAADGLAAAAQVAGLATDHQGVWRARQLDLIDGVAAQAAQRLAGVAQVHLQQRAPGRQRHVAVTGIDAQFEFVRLEARLIGGAQQQQAVVDQVGDVVAVGGDTELGLHD